MTNLIPENKQKAVVRALQQAFGVSEFEDIQPLTAGLSTALVFRIVVQGRPVVLHLILREDAMADPTNQFACMEQGEKAGIAPHIWYMSIEDRLSITDFVEAKPWVKDARERYADTLRTLHSLPRFPKIKAGGGSYLDAMDGFVRKFQAANLLPQETTEEVFRAYDELIRVYPRNEEDQVSSHNDTKPENTIFDGTRVWLIDWEAAFLNDRYVDLSIVGNFFAANEAEEVELLEAYFGETPSEYQLARFFLMQQLLHVFYGTFLLLISGGGKSIDPDLKTTDYRTFHNRLLSGAVTVRPTDVKIEYAKVHLARAMEDVQTKRFGDALDLVAARH